MIPHQQYPTHFRLESEHFDFAIVHQSQTTLGFFQHSTISMPLSAQASHGTICCSEPRLGAPLGCTAGFLNTAPTHARVTRLAVGDSSIVTSSSSGSSSPDCVSASRDIARICARILWRSAYLCREPWTLGTWGGPPTSICSIGGTDPQMLDVSGGANILNTAHNDPAMLGCQPMTGAAIEPTLT